MSNNLLLNLTKGTLLSMLVFFSISFMYVLYRITPVTIGDTYSMQIGFPFKYYEQFQVSGSDFLNSGWMINNLILDCVITWVAVCGIYLLIKVKSGH